ncbi:MAG: type II toxin-antitoxin system VapC family toxin [Patescibacteria group bacterium]
MKYLLDTHTLIWFMLNDSKLGHSTRRMLTNSGQGEVAISVIAFVEIEIKLAVGKLKGAEDIQQKVTAQKLPLLPIQAEHAKGLRGLELIHRDPFGRMLIAQAMSENLTLITGDSDILKYSGVKLIDARQ